MLQFNLLRPGVRDKCTDKSKPDFHSAKMKRVRQETYETFWDLMLPQNFFLQIRTITSPYSFHLVYGKKFAFAKSLRNFLRL